MNPVFIIIMICLFTGLVVMVFKKWKMTNIDFKNDELNTANRFLNVTDIKDRFLYTSDGHIIMYMKISSISIDLLSVVLEYK